MTLRDIKAAVFDIGGVLLDWDPRHLYRKLFADPDEMAAFLGGICTPRWHQAHDLGADTEQSCRDLAAVHPSLAEEIMAWSRRSEEMIAGQIDEGVDVLAELTASGLRCLALSNMEADRFALRQARYPFFGYFDGCVISGIEGVAKPDRRIFEVLLSRYGLEPAATVFIDDTAANIAVARDLGLVAIRYSAGGQLRHDLRHLGLLAGAAGSGDDRSVTPRLQQLIADLPVHVCTKPAAHLVE
jgi:2-haloacid dehalogenase